MCTWDILEGGNRNEGLFKVVKDTKVLEERDGRKKKEKEGDEMSNQKRK